MAPKPKSSLNEILAEGKEKHEAIKAAKLCEEGFTLATKVVENADLTIGDLVVQENISFLEAVQVAKQLRAAVSQDANINPPAAPPMPAAPAKAKAAGIKMSVVPLTPKADIKMSPSDVAGPAKPASLPAARVPDVEDDADGGLLALPVACLAVSPPPAKMTSPADPSPSSGSVRSLPPSEAETPPAKKAKAPSPPPAISPARPSALVTQTPKNKPARAVTWAAPPASTAASAETQEIDPAVLEANKAFWNKYKVPRTKAAATEATSAPATEATSAPAAPLGVLKRSGAPLVDEDFEGSDTYVDPKEHLRRGWWLGAYLKRFAHSFHCYALSKSSEVECRIARVDLVYSLNHCNT